MDTMEPIDWIKQARKELKPNSLKNYKDQLNTMKRLLGDDNWWHGEDPQPAIDAIHNATTPPHHPSSALRRRRV